MLPFTIGWTGIFVSYLAFFIPGVAFQWLDFDQLITLTPAQWCLHARCLLKIHIDIYENVKKKFSCCASWNFMGI